MYAICCLHIVNPTGFEFALNFSDELTEIILETKYMEQLGFPVPELARSVALQEEKFTSYQDGIKKCLQRYPACIAALAPAEVQKTYSYKLYVLSGYVTNAL